MTKAPETSLKPSARPFQSAQGFSLIELLITLSIIALLFSLMMPTFKLVRSSAERLMCASNMRVIHYGLHGYANDNRRHLPQSVLAESARYQETMALTNIIAQSATNQQERDGLGRLWRNSAGSSYLDNCQCLYCPCHQGEHPYQRYEAELNADYNISPNAGPNLIYSNYQYAGDHDSSSKKQIFFDDGTQRNVIVSDGLRTQSDFNHNIGGNALLGDGSISWFGRKAVGYNLEKLPIGQSELPLKDQLIFSAIWSSIQMETTK